MDYLSCSEPLVETQDLVDLSADTASPSICISIWIITIKMEQLGNEYWMDSFICTFPFKSEIILVLEKKWSMFINHPVYSLLFNIQYEIAYDTLM